MVKPGRFILRIAAAAAAALTLGSPAALANGPNSAPAGLPKRCAPVAGLIGVSRDVTRQRQEQRERELLDRHLHAARRFESLGMLTLPGAA